MASIIDIEVDPNAPDEEFSAVLDGRFYIFTKVWNGREGSWYLSIFTEAGEPIATGAKCLIDMPLFKRSADPRLPPGVLKCEDTSGKRIAPGLLDLGERVRLRYYEAG